MKDFLNHRRLSAWLTSTSQVRSDSLSDGIADDKRGKSDSENSCNVHESPVDCHFSVGHGPAPVSEHNRISMICDQFVGIDTAELAGRKNTRFFKLAP